MLSQTSLIILDYAPPTIKKAACLIFLIFAILERFSDSRSSPAQKQRAGSKCVFGFCATMQAVSESVERRTVKWEKEDAPCLKVGGQSSADLSLCDILQRAARYMHQLLCTASAANTSQQHQFKQVRNVWRWFEKQPISCLYSWDALCNIFLLWSLIRQ